FKSKRNGCSLYDIVAKIDPDVRPEVRAVRLVLDEGDRTCCRSRWDGRRGSRLARRPCDRSHWRPDTSDRIDFERAVQLECDRPRVFERDECDINRRVQLSVRWNERYVHYIIRHVKGRPFDLLGVNGKR